MASVTKRSYGNVDFKLGELRYFRTHVYATLVAMTSDVATAEGRIVYNLETGRHYFGKSGSWVGLGVASSLRDPVANVAALPPSGNTAGDIIVTIDGGDGKPAVFGWDGSAWLRIADHRIILSDGTIEFSAIPSVTDANTVLATAPKNLTTKKYVDDADAAHLAAPDPHNSAALISAHNVDGGAHADIRGPLIAHIADPAPHTGHETPAGAQNKVDIHNADGAAHGGVASISYVTSALEARAALTLYTEYAAPQALVPGTDCFVKYTGPGAEALTLPAANFVAGGYSMFFTIKNEGAGILTITAAGADTIFTTVGGNVVDTLAVGASATYRSDGVSVWSKT